MDKFAFAQLISFISRQYAISFTKLELADLSNLIDAGMPAAPEPQVIKTNPNTLVVMLQAIKDCRKIDAIRATREMTGLGLKESKDLVEQNWIAHNPHGEKKGKAQIKLSMKNAIDRYHDRIKDGDTAAEEFLLHGFTVDQFQQVKQFIDSFWD